MVCGLSAGAEWIRTFSSALDRRRFRGFVRVGVDRRPIGHPSSCRWAADRLLEIIDPARRAIAGTNPQVILNSRRGPSEAGTMTKVFIGESDYTPAEPVAADA